MFQSTTKKGVRISILLLLILGVFGTTLITDFPFPTAETEAGLLHLCCQQRCFVDGLGRIHCLPTKCKFRFHWPGRPAPC